MTIRLGVDDRIKVEREANRLGRSLTQEVEARLARTFLEDELLGGGQYVGLLRNLASSQSPIGPLLLKIGTFLQFIEMSYQGDWNADFETYWSSVGGIETLLESEMSGVDLNSDPTDKSIARIKTLSLDHGREIARLLLEGRPDPSKLP